MQGRGSFWSVEPELVGKFEANGLVPQGSTAKMKEIYAQLNVEHVLPPLGANELEMAIPAKRKSSNIKRKTSRSEMVPGTWQIVPYENPPTEECTQPKKPRTAWERPEAPLIVSTLPLPPSSSLTNIDRAKNVKMFPMASNSLRVKSFVNVDPATGRAVATAAKAHDFTSASGADNIPRPSWTNERSLADSWVIPMAQPLPPFCMTTEDLSAFTTNASNSFHPLLQ